jgi:hypothetical protein
VSVVRTRRTAPSLADRLGAVGRRSLATSTALLRRAHLPDETARRRFVRRPTRQGIPPPRSAEVAKRNRADTFPAYSQATALLSEPQQSNPSAVNLE